LVEKEKNLEKLRFVISPCKYGTSAYPGFQARNLEKLRLPVPLLKNSSSACAECGRKLGEAEVYLFAMKMRN